MTGEAAIRLGSFLAILAAMLLLETLFPRRERTAPRTYRAFHNLCVVALASMVVRLFPVLPVGLAFLMNEKDAGLFGLVALPFWLEGMLAFLLFDLLIYWQHRWFHRIQILWRVHRMHHADVDLDTTTALRFHPIEIAASMVLKLVAVAVLGPPALAVLIFEVVLNGCAMFNHANLKIPQRVDRVLRLVLVTPDMHRVHHSTDMREANHNLGFNLPWWDRLFGTYQAQPKDGHEAMAIGMNIFRERRWWNVAAMLTIPFR